MHPHPAFPIPPQLMERIDCDPNPTANLPCPPPTPDSRGLAYTYVCIQYTRAECYLHVSC